MLVYLNPYIASILLMGHRQIVQFRSVSGNANILDPRSGPGQNVGHDLDLNCFTLS